MSDNHNDGGPAFPLAAHDDTAQHRLYFTQQGMTLREYAAIKLKVPSSGRDWLDAMIIESRRNDDAAQALQGVLSDSAVEISNEALAKYCYDIADAMLAERERRNGGAK